MEQLRRENARLRACEENRLKDFSYLEAKSKAQLERSAANYRRLAVEADRATNRTATRHAHHVSQLEGDAMGWRRKYENLRDQNPEAETFDIRLDEMTAANKALMDENTRKNEQISRLEAQLQAAVLLKNQLPPSSATVTSNIADRDQLQEHEKAQLQADSQEKDELRQEIQALRKQNLDLCEVKSAMWEEGTRLAGEKQALTEQCQDLSAKLNTLSQQGGENDDVKATQLQHDALKREVARLEAMRVQYEGETTVESETPLVEKKALRQAEEWVNDREKVLSSQFQTELDQARAQLRADIEAEFVQKQEALRGVKEELEQALQREKQGCQLEAAAKETYFQGQKRAEAGCKKAADELKRFKKHHPQLVEVVKQLRKENQELKKEVAKAVVQKKVETPKTTSTVGMLPPRQDEDVNELENLWLMTDEEFDAGLAAAESPSVALFAAQFADAYSAPFPPDDD